MRLTTLLLALLGLLATACVASGTTAATDTTAPAPTTAGSVTGAEPVATTTPTAAPRGPVVLGFAGDTSFTHGNDRRDPLGAVTGLLSAPDLVVVNLETAVADEGVGRPADKEFVFRSPPASLDLLVAAGVDAVALANNHVLDHGPEAVAQTVRELDARGLHRVGAGVDEAEAYRPLVLSVGAWRIGLVSVSAVPCDWSASGINSRPQVAWACPPFAGMVEAAVAEAAAEADVVVAMVHGGVEGEPCPSPAMVDLVATLAGLGVDVVVGSHPHVLQGVGRVDDALVVHSTGNFSFPSARGRSARSAVFLVEVAESGLSLRIEPVVAPAGVVRPAEGDERQGILDEIAAHSSGWVIEPDGSARPDPSAGPGACGPTGS